MHSVWQDIRFAARMLRKNPSFAVVAVLTLGLGIGANTAIFSVINAVLLKPLPYQNAGRLVQVSASDLQTHANGIAVSFTKYEQIRSQNQAFESIAAYFPWTLSLNAGGEPEAVSGTHVSVDFFRMLGVTPALGRAFLPEEDQPGGRDVAMLSDSFWHSHFGGDEGILGRVLTLDGKDVTVVGVLPKTFAFPLQVPEPEIWMPRVDEIPTLRREQVHSGAGYLGVIARLRPTATLPAAVAELKTI